MHRLPAQGACLEEAQLLSRECTFLRRAPPPAAFGLTAGLQSQLLPADSILAKQYTRKRSDLVCSMDEEREGSKQYDATCS
jgi:hypothetical protein